MSAGIVTIVIIVIILLIVTILILPIILIILRLLIRNNRIPINTCLVSTRIIAVVFAACREVFGNHD